DQQQLVASRGWIGLAAGKRECCESQDGQNASHSHLQRAGNNRTGRSIMPWYMTRTEASSSTVAWTASDLRANPHDAPDKAERVQKMFAAIARRYDLNNRLHSFGRDQAWRRKAVAICEVQPTDDVLDVACGTGDLTEAFAVAR